MRKFRLLLTGFLCVALVIPSVNAGAVVINRHSMESEENRSRYKS